MRCCLKSMRQIRGIRICRFLLGDMQCLHFDLLYDIVEYIRKHF